MNPNVLGYDHFEGPFIGAINDYYNWQKYTNGVSSTITTYATTENVNNAVSWIKGQTGKPVFLWVAFNAPHSPFHLPPAGLYSDLTLTGTPQQINANPKRYFKASIEALDHEIGRLFDSLQVLNRLDSTDFIFMGDNGNALQTAQIANVNQAKGTIYQYGVHVPFLVSGPSVVNPGRVSGALVNTVDVFATVLELFGYTQWQTQIPPNKPVDSKSLLPILKDETSDVRPWAFTEIFTLTGDPNDGKAIRNSSYKLMKFDAGSEALFNLNSDAGEAFNLLNGTLTPTELTNYQYLCGEMTNLVGTNGFCNPVLSSLPNKESNPFSVYPNPAKGLVVVKSDRIYKEGISCELLDL
ncbi:MAG TPA: sulfatase-like hydrolase/transferase, partial [Catalimonadaceae bacterium]|nr:sulfatase-like hydrolase/transferase [Catalimonadaceae bacterium]